MGWGMETVQHGFIDYLRFSFLIAGHTKFDVDCMFSVTAKAYNASDVFNTQELLHVTSQYDKISGIIVVGIQYWTGITKCPKSTQNYQESKNSMISILLQIPQQTMQWC